MGLLEDAYAAAGIGHEVTVLASAGTGYGGNFEVRFNFKAPANSKVTITTGVTAGATAGVSVSGNNIPPLAETPITDSNVVTIEVPPGTDQVEILFFFNGVGFDLEDGPLGSLTFNSVELNDPSVQGDLLKFSVNDGVRVLNHQYALYEHGTGAGSDIFNESTALNVDKYPIFGDTESILSADSGVITKRGNLNLGTN